jgi:hypothetical protein
MLWQTVRILLPFIVFCFCVRNKAFPSQINGSNSSYLHSGQKCVCCHTWTYKTIVSFSIIVQQDATIHSLLYFCKLLFMFRVVTPPIIRSTYNCNYTIWYWSNRLCYLPLSWKVWNISTIAEGSRAGLTSTRCCNYSYMCSWWWVELPPEVCRAVYRNIIKCI